MIMHAAESNETLVRNKENVADMITAITANVRKYFESVPTYFYY